jgi:glutamate-ammonia-ligase adenylyltransferase
MQPEPGPLTDRVAASLEDDPARSGARSLERIAKGLPLALPDRATGFLAGVFAGSPFLFGIAERRPDLLLKTLSMAPETHFDEVLARTAVEAAEASSTRDIMHVLRQGKVDIAFLIALADLAGIWPVETVTQRLSEAAGQFVSLAIRFLLNRAAQAERFYPKDAAEPEKGSGLIVLGMGKFGAQELNYSSDIDLVVFFDRHTAPVAPAVEPGAFFVRLTRDLVHILQERTGDGYVFRTDLRLRPDPASTQAAISTDAAFRYYESLGQNWERAAFIKARPVAGDTAAGSAFMEELSPYIWRKYLDYNAIFDIHAMKRQIHAAKGHERIAVAGHNLKLGRGGIREIEFFVQSQQLIGGGRQPALRTRQTLSALAALTEFEWITVNARDELSAAYRELRRLEHRLQMVGDQQTHTMPPEGPLLDSFARFAGYSSTAALESNLRRHMESVQRHYGALFERVPELTPQRVTGNLVFTGDADDPGTMETIAKLGFKNPSSVIAAIKGWHYGRYRAMRSARAREILTEFTPALLEALADTGDPDLALATFDRFLSEAPTALQLFSMLRTNPPLLRLMAQIMGSAPRLARILTRRRSLMDAILDPGYLGERPSKEELRRLVRHEIMEPRSYEDRLNRARAVGQEQAFTIGVGLLSRKSSPKEAGLAYSLLAEALIETLLDAVQEHYGGALPPPAVIAMGKLGGFEMTATSDVDLIAVYEALPGHAGGAAEHYARMTQRLISALSAPTAEGALYAVDLRLRPSGKAGPAAVQLDGFLKYQTAEAWTWEHMALTRARPVAGPPRVRERVTEIVREVLTMRRNRAKTAADVREMRALIEKEKGTLDVWHTRNHRGGLVDVEFIAQFLQIQHAADEPSLLNQNTAQALANLTEARFLSPPQGETLLRAAELYQGVAHILRLCTEGLFDPKAAPRDLMDLLLFTAGEKSLPALEARLAATFSEVRALFEQLIV